VRALRCYCVNARPGLNDRLSQRRALIGLLQTHASPVLSDVAAACGYDLLILDDEHGVFSTVDLLQSISVLNNTGTAAFVRVREGDTQAVGRYLDMGADGIVVPGVSTAEQAVAYVRAMHYPPAGTRGFGASAHRGTRYGLDVSQHMNAPRGHAALVLMVESVASVTSIESILSVDGVDAVVVGPSDLSASVGSLGDFSSPAYGQAMARVERAAQLSGKILGTAPHPGHSVEMLAARGHRLFIVGADTMLIREALASALQGARSKFDSTFDTGVSRG
jgi:2-keto-3-deoxy-L-rhamnonate aldolase RhmA